MIRGHRLAVGYRERPLLVDLCFHLEPGECWAIVGRNGSGKSALLSTLVGLHGALGGTVEIEGKNLEEWPRAELALFLAYLPQRNPAVFPYTVEEFVRFGRLPWRWRRRTTSSTDDAIVNRAIVQMSLEPLRLQRLTALSGGEVQRACLAQALAQDTKILLLDEPLAHLDLLYQIRVMRLARDLADHGRIILLVTHDLPLAWRHCDGLAVLGAGGMRLVRRDQPALARSVLEAAYGVRFEVNGELVIKE